MGSRGFKEVVRDRKSIPTFVMMGVSLAWILAAPALKSSLYLLLGI
jgi:hypothetical protein